MSLAHTSVQFDERLLRLLDERAAREGRSRSVLIREAVDAYMHDEDRAEIDRQLVEGYERIPATERLEPW